MTIFASADTHFFHRNIIKYCNRPFQDLNEMHRTLIMNHNSIVRSNDTVYHLGDFAFTRNWDWVFKVIQRLNGNNIFIPGSHDHWMKKAKNVAITDRIHEISVNGHRIVLCHYAMRTWPKSHHGSWNLHGHSHGGLTPFKNQYDVGVDNNNYYPVDIIKKISELEKEE